MSSEAQLARELARQAGLSEDTCQVLVLVRELDDGASYDKVASVAMVEHVGSSQISKYFDRVLYLLKPGGSFLNHGIAGTHYGEASSRREFLRRYDFSRCRDAPVRCLAETRSKRGLRSGMSKV